MNNKEITEILIFLGFGPDKTGFTYLENVLSEIYADPSLTLKKVYRKIMLLKDTTECTIDSSIRNAIHSAFDSGKLTRLNIKMGVDIIEQNICPTNKLLIFSLLRYMQGKAENYYI